MNTCSKYIRVCAMEKKTVKPYLTCSDYLLSIISFLNKYTYGFLLQYVKYNGHMI